MLVCMCLIWLKVCVALCEALPPPLPAQSVLGQIALRFSVCALVASNRIGVQGDSVHLL
jgi:hypothetical protein